MGVDVRPATYAGSWYEREGLLLRKMLEEYEVSCQGMVELMHPEECLTSNPSAIRAIIGPHASPHYSGRTAAYVYKIPDLKNVKRIFLLGPSHYSHFMGCMLSSYKQYSTPLGNLEIDSEAIEELKSCASFVSPSKQAENVEHSLEMHLPFIYKMMERNNKTSCKIVPIIVGDLDKKSAASYGAAFAKFFDETSLFIISSDFCHWGSRFSYYYLGEGINPENTDEIWKHVRDLDFKAIKLIENLDISGFTKYLKETGITICGRNPILILLAIIANLKDGNPKLRFIAYDQSDKATSTDSSSVSYASAYLTM